MFLRCGSLAHSCCLIPPLHHLDPKNIFLHWCIFNISPVVWLNNLTKTIWSALSWHHMWLLYGDCFKPNGNTLNICECNPPSPEPMPSETTKALLNRQTQTRPDKVKEVIVIRPAHLKAHMPAERFSFPVDSNLALGHTLALNSMSVPRLLFHEIQRMKSEAQRRCSTTNNFRSALVLLFRFSVKKKNSTKHCYFSWTSLKGWACQNGFMWEWYFILTGNM